MTLTVTAGCAALHITEVHMSAFLREAMGQHAAQAVLACLAIAVGQTAAMMLVSHLVVLTAQSTGIAAPAARATTSAVADVIR